MKFARTLLLLSILASIAAASGTDVRWSPKEMEARGISISMIRRNSETYGECMEVGAFIEGSERNSNIRFVILTINSPCGAVLSTLPLDQREDGRRVIGPLLSRELVNCTELVFNESSGRTSASIGYHVSLGDVLEWLKEKVDGGSKIEGSDKPGT